MELEILEDLKSINDLEEKAGRLVSFLFSNKYDKAGEIYLGHLHRVKDNFLDSNLRVVSLLHDTIEDTTLDSNDLILLGFPKSIVDSILVLTNTSDNYDEFITKIIESNNKVSMLVKLADLEDNMNLKRLEKVTEKDLKRNEKYKKAYKRISDALKKEK